MAITKILTINSSGKKFEGKHLKQAIEYITALEKTQAGRFVSGINCQPGAAFQQMMATKRKYGKTDKRQGYHIIISLEEENAEPETVFKITGKFAEEFLGNGYEAVYVVHDNTAHCHGHIIFNSVNYLDGKKFRYEKGDWAEKMQPVTNRLCEEYGFSSVNIKLENSTMPGYGTGLVHGSKKCRNSGLQKPGMERGNIPEWQEEKIIKNAELKGIQKTWYARLCYIQGLSGNIHNKRYRKHREMRELEECYSQYMFLVENNINSLNGLCETINNLEEELEGYKKERKRLYRDKKQYNGIFSAAGQMEKLLPAQKSFLAGDSFFEREHTEYQRLEDILKSRGFTFGNVKGLQAEFSERLKSISVKCRAVYKDLGRAEGVIKGLGEMAKLGRQGHGSKEAGKQPGRHGRLEGGRYGK